jgi:hypothetical protein
MMMCTSCMSNYYLCDILEIIDNKKIRENWCKDGDVHILYIKRYVRMTYSELEMWYDIWWYVHTAYQENYI